MSQLLNATYGEALFVILGRLAVVLVILPLHAYVQALVATKMGDDTPKINGRLSLDPRTQLDIVGAVLVLISGMGWVKMIPVNPNNFKDRKKGIILSSLSGPIFDLCMALVLFLVYRVTGMFPGSASFAGRLLFVLNSASLTMFRTMLVFALINLIPFPPMDGYKAVRAFSGESTFWDMMNTNLNFLWAALLVFIPAVGNFFYMVAGYIETFLLAITSFLA